MPLKRVRMELARTHDFPQGSNQHGYAFTAPLDADGRLDPELWQKHRDLCRVRRFWGSEEEQLGHLVRRPGGSWAFHYDIQGDPDDDDPGYRFNAETFRPGEYVSVMEDEELMPFRIIVVRDVDPEKG